MTRLCAALALVAALVLACAGKKDIGSTCTMTKPKGDGGVEPILMTALPDGGLDFVSLGTAECDDMVCLRTNGSANPDPDGTKARGYCTAGCLDDSDCQPDYQGNSGTMKCATLLLDQKFLDMLKQNDPETYEQIFGAGAQGSYCIKPRK